MLLLKLAFKGKEMSDKEYVSYVRWMDGWNNFFSEKDTDGALKEDFF